MTECDWIVCERSGRWTAALRMAIRRQSVQCARTTQLREVRSLEELAAQLDERPLAMALVEVRRTNLTEALMWLADAAASYPRARFVALLDTEGIEHELRNSVLDVLFAAGAVDISDSPRHLHQVLTLGRRHTAWRTRQPAALAGRQTFAEWAWAALPWQDERRPVG